MTKSEEYYFIKGARHGLLVAKELNDTNKITEAAKEMSRLVKVYKDNFADEINDEDQLLEL